MNRARRPESKLLALRPFSPYFSLFVPRCRLSFIPLRGKEMLFCVRKVPAEGLRYRSTERRVRLYHVERVHVRVVDVQLRRGTSRAQPFKIANGLGIERLAVAHEGIGRRQAGEVLQPCRSSIGRKLCPVRPAQIEPPRKMIVPTVTGGIHPTQKPVELCQYFIKTYTNEGEVVADICAGSGTTAVTAINTGCRYLCFENAPAFFGSAVQRIDEARLAVAGGGKGV